MDNPVTVSLKAGPYLAFFFRLRPAFAVCAKRCLWMKGLSLNLLCLLTNGHNSRNIQKSLLKLFHSHICRGCYFFDILRLEIFLLQPHHIFPSDKIRLGGYVNISYLRLSCLRLKHLTEWH